MGGRGYTLDPGSWDNAPLHPEIAEITAGSFKRKNPPEIRGTGHVVRSLEAALWAFYNSGDFKTGALLSRSPEVRRHPRFRRSPRQGTPGTA